MSFRRLMVLATCASLLGLASARLAGPRLPGIMSALSRATDPGDLVQMMPAPDGGAAPDPSTIALMADEAAEPTPAAGARRSGRRAKPAPARDRLADELARGIRKLGEGRYEVERGAIELALRNLGALAGMVRVAPDVRDGRQSGFRLVALTTDGPFARLGLRRDDVLVSVNGLDIRTPDSALEAHAKLKSASRFVLGLLRDGRELVQVYTVQYTAKSP
jgi:hypothetical protein